MYASNRQFECITLTLMIKKKVLIRKTCLHEVGIFKYDAIIYSTDAIQIN